MSDYKGARALLDQLPKAKYFLADRGYDAGWLRDGLRARVITLYIPPKKHRKADTPYDKILYKQCYKMENMFGWLKDWRRIAIFSAIQIAAVVIWWL